MGYMNPIQAQDIKVGDILFVIAGGDFAFTNQEVKKIDLNDLDYISTESTDENIPEAFGVKRGYYTFYLIERPKKPLPTAIGSVVEVAGVKYFRVLEDNENHAEWAYSDGGFITDISSENLVDLDFTVV